MSRTFGLLLLGKATDIYRKPFPHPTVTVAFTTPGKPIKITGADTFEHVIMLMRLA